MNEIGELIPTRQSLLSRLKDWNDQESWKVFFDTYWKLIYTTAIKAGLTDAEAQDVVQETVISVMKKIPEFEYDAKKGSFKGWLHTLTKWRISDQLRKRQRRIQHPNQKPETSANVDVYERAVDPVSRDLEAAWDEEWELNIWDAAVARVKRKVEAKHFQIFDLYVCKKWPVRKVSQTLKVNAAKVYVIKHRVSKLIKREIAHLRARPI